jgi:hypothetical protein
MKLFLVYFSFPERPLLLPDDHRLPASLHRSARLDVPAVLRLLLPRPHHHQRHYLLLHLPEERRQKHLDGLLRHPGPDLLREQGRHQRDVQSWLQVPDLLLGQHLGTCFDDHIGAIVSFNIDQAANSNFFDQIFTFSFFEESFERIPFFYFNGNGLYPQAYLSSGLAVVLSFFQFILFCPSCLGFFE